MYVCMYVHINLLKILAKRLGSLLDDKEGIIVNPTFRDSCGHWVLTVVYFRVMSKDD